jgi:hypothetical protein
MRGGEVAILWAGDQGSMNWRGWNSFFTSEESELADDETCFNKVALLAAILEALNTLIQGMQWKDENILTCNDKFNYFNKN